MYRQYEKVSYDECLKYLRKSRSDDPTLTVEEVLEKHDSQLNDYSMRELGGLIPESQTYREVKSSETIEERPEMCRLLKDIENPKIKAVLVMEIERLSRGDLMDAGLIIRVFRYTRTLIITPTRTYDLNDESDRMIAEMLLKAGNQYLEYSKKVMKRGKDIAAMNGEFIAKCEPYGYKKISYREGRKNVKTLEAVPNEADIVKLIFESYADKNMSMQQIADMLNDMKAKPKFRDIWTRGTISEMLMNPVYMGKIRWNYRVDVKSWEDQKMVVSRPRRSLEDCTLVDGKHEAIISEDLFERAYSRKSQNVPLKKSNELKNPLAGMFYCAKCGKAMKMRCAHGKNEARFECTEVKICGNGSATYTDVMKHIYSKLEGYIEDFEVSMDNDNSDEVSRHKQMIDSMERRLLDVEKKELSLWDKYTEEGMPKAVFDKLLEKVTTEKKELKDALKNAYESMPTQEDYEEKIASFSLAMQFLMDEEISAGIKNTYLRSVIQKITFEREKSVLLNKKLAEEMGVAYPYPLCYHHYPIKMDITPQV